MCLKMSKNIRRRQLPKKLLCCQREIRQENPMDVLSTRMSVALPLSVHPRNRLLFVFDPRSSAAAACDSDGENGFR